MLSNLKSLLQSKAAQSVACRKDGDAHLRESRMDEALQAYERALALDPGNLDACVGLGYVFNERGDYASAKATLAKALTIDPDHADVHYMLGTIARHEGDVTAAMQHFERAIECRPDFEFAHRDLFTLLSQRGEAQRAREVIDRAAASCPTAAGLHYARSKMFAEQGDHAQAIASLRRASELAPAHVAYHKDLADALAKSGDADGAIASYDKAVWFDPDFFEARVALADMLVRHARPDAAIPHYHAAIGLRADHAPAHVNLGVALRARGKLDEAIASYRRAIDIDPRLVVAHVNLGNDLMTKGANAEAIATFEKVLELDPRNDAAHVLAALKGGDAERAPSDYVAKLFDWYAPTFDSHLVEGLGYSVPEKLAALLQPHAPGAKRWTVLDLGCGTGLAGVAVAPFAQSMVGVDLSGKMLDKARERGLYDRLEQRDLLDMMQTEPPASYDLVVAADVFVYIGKLDELALECRRLLRPEGLFAFSVESLDSLDEAGAAGSTARDYRLNDTGRFAHSADYLARLCKQSGFAHLGTTTTQSRINQGKPVQGYLVLWKN
jgi:predicted TPR repeat methyltransferase